MTHRLLLLGQIGLACRLGRAGGARVRRRGRAHDRLGSLVGVVLAVARGGVVGGDDGDRGSHDGRLGSVGGFLREGWNAEVKRKRQPGRCSAGDKAG